MCSINAFKKSGWIWNDSSAILISFWLLIPLAFLKETHGKTLSGKDEYDDTIAGSTARWPKYFFDILNEISFLYLLNVVLNIKIKISRSRRLGKKSKIL